MPEIRPVTAQDLPAVAVLFQRLLRSDGVEPHALADYLKTLFLEGPNYDPEMPSKVHIRDDGTVSGFLGVVVPATATSSPRRQAQQEQSIETGGGGSLGPQGCVNTEAESGVPATIAPARSGALVDGVLCGTGAAAAGITPGDVITAAAGRPVSSPDALTAIMGGSQPGTVVPVTWVAVTGNTRTSLIRLEVAPAA